MSGATSTYALPYQTLTDPPNGPDLGKNLAEKVEAVLSDGTKGLTVATVTTTGAATIAGALTVAGDRVTGGRGGVNGFAVTSGTDTTTSGPYVNLAGTGSQTSFSFTKRFAASRLRVAMSAGMSTTVASGAVFGVRINGVDYDVCAAATASGARAVGSGTAYISGVPAGTYTVQGRWKRWVGTSTLSRDVNDWLSIDVQEGA
jgi:hypothetical protein